MRSSKWLVFIRSRLAGFHRSLTHFLSVPEKGKKLIEDYEAKTTIRGIWERYHIAILAWIFSIFAALIVGFLIAKFGLK
jgi:hypothetical protein